MLRKCMPQSAKHDEYSSFSKRENGVALYIYSAFRSPDLTLYIYNGSRNKHGKEMHAPKRKTR